MSVDAKPTTVYPCVAWIIISKNFDMLDGPFISRERAERVLLGCPPGAQIVGYHARSGHDLQSLLATYAMILVDPKTKVKVNRTGVSSTLPHNLGGI